MDKPYYPYLGISSPLSLSKTLGIHPKILTDLSKRTQDSYTQFEITTKDKTRTVYEPKFELKKLQKRINSRIFELVQYPTYLQGGIKDNAKKRDYVENAKIHARANTIINIDVKNFYDNIKPNLAFNIYKYLFKFSDDVCTILTSLTTYNNKVPQGACTSSYIANLVFFNSEYDIVSKLRSRGINYSRLIDDVTVSSERILSEDEVTDTIRMISAMFRKHGLKINNKKTKKEYRASRNKDFRVTGLWVGHKEPKIVRKERKYIRQLVHICELEYKKSPYSEEYHKLWNRVSGLVTKLSRLEHHQHKKLRKRLALLLPLFDEKMKQKIILDIKKLVNRKNKNITTGLHARIGKINHNLGILGRTDKNLAKKLRIELFENYKNIPTKSEFWG